MLIRRLYLALLCEYDRIVDSLRNTQQFLARRRDGSYALVIDKSGVHARVVRRKLADMWPGEFLDVIHATDEYSTRRASSTYDVRYISVIE